MIEDNILHLIMTTNNTAVTWRYYKTTDKANDDSVTVDDSTYLIANDMKYGIVCTWLECDNPVEVYRTKREAKKALYRIVSDTWDTVETPILTTMYYKARAYFGFPTKQPGFLLTDTDVYIVKLDSVVPDSFKECYD